MRGRSTTDPAASSAWPGLDAESLIMSLDGLSHHELVIGDESGVEVIPLPAIELDVIELAPIGERLLLLGRSVGGDGDLALWTRVPGADWERLAPPAPGGAVVNHVSIASDGRSALLTIASGEHGEVLETWHTIDGETWRVANGGASERNGVVGTIHPTDFGWAAYDAFEESTRMTVSPDGIVWQEISADVPDGHAFSDQRVAALGHIVVVSWFEDFGDRTTWVGRVDAG